MTEQEPQFIEIPTMTFRKVKAKRSSRLPIIIGAGIAILGIILVVIAISAL